jgi:DNA polymerase
MFDKTDNRAAKREKLKEFYLEIKNCKSCRLGELRTNFVFGSGNSNAEILLIGEAPGKNEDIQGKPFVGQAGKLLDDLLASIGFGRNDVFIANVLKCRPPQNRDPDITEINTCKGYLFKQIEIINPLIICTMGKYSTQLILETSEIISRLRGKVFEKNGKTVIPINHPAAALYTPSRTELLREDFKRLKQIYDVKSKNRGFSGDSNAENKGTESAEPADSIAKEGFEDLNDRSMQEVNVPDDKKEQLGLF